MEDASGFPVPELRMLSLEEAFRKRPVMSPDLMLAMFIEHIEKTLAPESPLARAAQTAKELRALAPREEDAGTLASGAVSFASAFAPTIEMVPEDDRSLADERVHVQAAQNLTACGLVVDTVRVADVGETVNCAVCMEWLDEEEEVTPPRGISIAVAVEATLDVDPVVLSLHITTPPDGRQHRVIVPQSILDAAQLMLTVEDPRRVSWTLQVLPSDNQAKPSQE